MSFESSSEQQRKGSLDSVPSIQLEALPRKLSNDTTSVKIDDLLAPEDERKVASVAAPKSGESTAAAAAAPGVSALEHLDALADSNKTQQQPKEDDSSFASSGQRMLFEAMMGNSKDEGREAAGRERLGFWGAPRSKDSTEDGGGGGSGRGRLDSWGGLKPRRDRLESWGAMSDLSMQLGPDGAQQHTASGDDAAKQAEPAASAAATAGDDSKPNAVPSRIRVDSEGPRIRLDSIASLGDMSLSNPAGLGDGGDLAGDIQAYVAAAVASVGDQLVEIAGAVESVANAADSGTLDAIRKEMGLDSDISSAASPLIGAVSDGARAGGARNRRPRSWSTSSKLSVDYEAVQAAVDAAEAATGAFDLSKIASSNRPRQRRRPLPTKRARIDSAASSDNSNISPLGMTPPLSEGEIARIRGRARAAAGCPPPEIPDELPVEKKRAPLKKRIKRPSPPARKLSGMATPKISNTESRKPAPDPEPVVSSNNVPASEPVRGQASQKWESMFDCLLEFIQERRTADTANLSEVEKKEWAWDGNVPTNYKTESGKALGRWVNNQRSAKGRGTLKDEREERLVEAGLKWSVMGPNSWNEMLEELRIYVKEQRKNGRTWDGNVPASYQIKTRPNSKFAGEDKNLGRWVNRQRSLYHAKKLRKDRQKDLEEIGLKWSMLATMSWDSMFETLGVYVEDQKSRNGAWDGNVPATFRTNDTPPRALGRWINRQRSAYMKNKLKKEYVDKLNAIGLKWSVHQRNEHMGVSAASKQVVPEAAKSESVVENEEKMPTGIAV